MKNNLNYEEIGKRFVEVCENLDNMGVFYGKNYSGKYHEKYPHLSYWFSLSLDKHRGGFEANIYRDGDINETTATYHGDRNINSSLMILDILEKSYDKFVKDGLIGEVE